MDNNLEGLNGKLEKELVDMRLEIIKAGKEIQKNLAIVYNILPFKIPSSDGIFKAGYLKIKSPFEIEYKNDGRKEIKITNNSSPSWQVIIQPEIKGFLKSKETGNLEMKARSYCLGIQQGGVFGPSKSVPIKEFFERCANKYSKDPIDVVGCLKSMSSLPYHIKEYFEELKEQKKEIKTMLKGDSEKFIKSIDYISIYKINPTGFNTIFFFLEQERQDELIKEIKKLEPEERNQQTDDMLIKEYYGASKQLGGLQ